MTAGPLLPREHGAWGQLLVPLATALVLAPPTAASGPLALGIVAAFLSYEPLLVLLGHRGTRTREHDGARARRRFALLTMLAVPAIAWGLGRAPCAVLPWLLPPAVPTAAMGLLFVAGRPTGRAGELLASLALPAAAVPVVVAGGAGAEIAAVLATAWPVGFVSVAFAVRAVIDQGLPRSPAPSRLAATALVLLAWLAVAATVRLALLPAVAVAALTPLSAAALGTLAIFPPPQRLKVLGWSVVAASLGTAVLLVLGL